MQNEPVVLQFEQLQNLIQGRVHFLLLPLGGVPLENHFSVVEKIHLRQVTNPLQADPTHFNYQELLAACLAQYQENGWTKDYPLVLCAANEHEKHLNLLADLVSSHFVNVYQVVL